MFKSKVPTEKKQSNPIVWAVAVVVISIGVSITYQVMKCAPVTLQVLGLLNVATPGCKQKTNCLASPDVIKAGTPKAAAVNQKPCFDYTGRTGNNRTNNDAWFRVKTTEPGTFHIRLSGISTKFSLQLRDSKRALIKKAINADSAETQKIEYVANPGEYLVRPQPMEDPSEFRLKVDFEKM